MSKKLTDMTEMELAELIMSIHQETRIRTTGEFDAIHRTIRNWGWLLTILLALATAWITS